MKIIVTAFLVMLSSLLAAQVQSHTISGSITDGEGVPVVVGDMILYQGDSIVNHTSISDGVYKMEIIRPSTYELVIRCLGYEEVKQEIRIDKDRTIDFTLKHDANLLSEITVVEMRESISYEQGNVKVAMANSIFSQQPSTLDAIGMMPGIITDPISQTISIIGAGNPLLYIGNRNITLDELLAIPVTNIKTIEIIRNPSSKYEANGASVLLITLYKNLDDGIQVELTENAVKRRNFNNYAGINSSIRVDKLEARANFGFNSLITWEGVDNVFEVPDQGVFTEFSAISEGVRPQYVAGAGLYYQLNDEDYISVNGNLRKHTTNAPLSSNSITEFSNRIDTAFSMSEEDETRGFYTGNINYNNAFPSTGSNLFLGVQASRYQRGLESVVFNDLDNTGLQLDQEREQDYEIDVIAARLDFEQHLGKGQVLEAGANVYSSVADAFQQFDIESSSLTTISNYDYEESNIALYGQVIGEAYGISYTLGLRSESTDFFGKFVEESIPLIDRQKTNLFPRANLSFAVDTLSSININFSSVIQRPNYLNATSITTYLTPYVEYQRNTNLVPSTARYLSANYQRGQQSLSLTLYTRDNLVQQSVTFDEESGRIINTPENFDLERGINIRLSNNFNYKKWRLTTMVSSSFNQLIDERGEQQDVVPYLYLYANNRFGLPKGFALGVNTIALTGRNSGIVKRNGRVSVGASLTKSIGGFTFSLNANDIFRGMNFEEEYTVNNIYSNSYRPSDIKSISLSVRYRFGKTFKSAYQNRDVDENLDRMG